MKRSSRYLLTFVMAATLVACDNPNIQQTAKNLGIDDADKLGDGIVLHTLKAECQKQLNNNSAFTDLILTPDQKATLCQCASAEINANFSADAILSLVKDVSIDSQVLIDKVVRAVAVCTSNDPEVQTLSLDEAVL